MLEQPAEPIRRIDEPVRQLAMNMVETMHIASGVGLAAPQVGVLRQLIVVDLSCGEKKKDIHILVNPEIFGKTGTVRDKEGCLSFPDLTTYVSRPKVVALRAMDLDENLLEIEADHYLARAFCHEIDHLSGICFVQRMGRFRRRMFLRKIDKLKKAGQW